MASGLVLGFPCSYALLFTVISQVVILPLTWMSLRLLDVPEHHELVAGSFVTAVYGLLAFTFGMIFAG